MILNNYKASGDELTIDRNEIQEWFDVYRVCRNCAELKGDAYDAYVAEGKMRILEYLLAYFDEDE